MTPPPPPEPSPYAPLYREAMSARASHRGHVANMMGRRRLTDAELVAYLASVLDRRPDARCTEEREVAVWLNRLVVAEDRWHRTWQRTVCARLMAAERAKLPPGPLPRVWLG